VVMKRSMVGLLALGMAAVWNAGSGCVDDGPEIGSGGGDDVGGSNAGGGDGGTLDTTTITVEVDPAQGTATVGQDLSATVSITITQGMSAFDFLTVTSDQPSVVSAPVLDDFAVPLRKMIPTASDDHVFNFEPILETSTASLSVSCKSVGTARLTFEGAIDYQDGSAPVIASDTLDITCVEQAVSIPLDCLIAFGNETLKGVDTDGKLVDVPDWGAGAGAAGTVLGGGAASIAVFAGYGDNSKPTTWLSDAFDPSTSGPSSWTTHTPPNVGTGQFEAVARYAQGLVLTSTTLGLFHFDGSAFVAATSPDTASQLACDDAGTCIAGAFNGGGILRSVDGETWTSNGGNEILQPITACDGLFVTYDIFNDAQYWSDDEGLTWNTGDLNAFNVSSFACGKGIWVASAQGTTWRSTDGAKTWQQAADAVAEVVFSAAADAFYSAGYGDVFPTVWRSTDGDTWTQTDDLGVAGAFNDIICF